MERQILFCPHCAEDVFNQFSPELGNHLANKETYYMNITQELLSDAALEDFQLYNKQKKFSPIYFKCPTSNCKATFKIKVNDTTGKIVETTSIIPENIEKIRQDAYEIRGKGRPAISVADHRRKLKLKPEPVSLVSGEEAFLMETKEKIEVPLEIIPKKEVLPKKDYLSEPFSELAEDFIIRYPGGAFLRA